MFTEEGVTVTVHFVDSRLGTVHFFCTSVDIEGRPLGNPWPSDGENIGMECWGFMPSQLLFFNIRLI